MKLSHIIKWLFFISIYLFLFTLHLSLVGINYFRLGANFQSIFINSVVLFNLIVWIVPAIALIDMYINRRLFRESVLKHLWIALPLIIICNFSLQEFTFTNLEYMKWIFHKAFVMTINVPWLIYKIYKLNQMFIHPLQSRVIKHPLFVVFSLFLMAQILLFIFANPITPRLEDEVAYTLQSIIFKSGNLWGYLPGESEKNIIPYVFNINGRFFSAHQHGWSYFLTIFQLLGIDRFGNLMLTLCNGLLIYHIAMKMNLGKNLSALASIAHLLTPLTIFLSRSYMSHTFALFLLLLMMYLYITIYQQKDKSKNRIRSYFLHTSFLFIGILLAFTRLQVFLTIFLAICMVEIYFILKTYHIDRNFRKIDSKILTINCITGVGAYLSLQLYSDLFNTSSALFMKDFMNQYVRQDCQMLGWGENFGCFPTYGTYGHTFIKTLLNGFSLLFSLNNVLSPFYLPLFIPALILSWKYIFIFRTKMHFIFILIFLIQFGMNSLYFHNGSENYFGRYIYEASPFLLIIFLLALKNSNITFRWNFTLIFTIVLVLPFYLKFATYGDYISSAVDLTIPGKYASNNIVVLQDKKGDLMYPDEHHKDRMIVINEKKTQRYLDSRFGPILANRVTRYQDGYFLDNNNNLYLQEIKSLKNIKQTKHILIYKFKKSVAKQWFKYLKIQEPDNYQLQKIIKYEDLLYNNLNFQ